MLRRRLRVCPRLSRSPCFLSASCLTLGSPRLSSPRPPYPPSLLTPFCLPASLSPTLSLALCLHCISRSAQSGHAPKATPTQALELRHIIRRLSAHPAIALWDGCNECQVVMGTPTAIYATFVMTMVAEEDASRAVWPSCPAKGWATGVHQLDSRPNGRPLSTPPKGGPELETHGPYQHGNGFPSVNGATKLELFDPQLPIAVETGPTGAALPNVFASEFGAVAMSSFESMAPTLAPQHWGLHGGQPDDTCTGGFGKDCEGVNVMAERNYPCDNMVVSYFGAPSHADYFNQTGEAVFKRQLYQCMLAQALNIKSNIEHRRSQNELGVLVWQFNEIWPTGGWGSIEYGTPVAGQVLGGRWKPLHYLYRRSVFADVMAACGGGGQCYVKNDLPGEPFKGTVTISSLEFASGTRKVLKTLNVALAEGAGASVRFSVDLSGVDPTAHLLLAECKRVAPASKAAAHATRGDSPSVVGRTGAVKEEETLSVNEMLFASPSRLVLPPANLSLAVAPQANTDGSINVTVSSDATALYVTLTTLSQGRFSDNAFAMAPGRTLLTFVPLEGMKVLPSSLSASLRVEHLQPHLFL